MATIAPISNSWNNGIVWEEVQKGQPVYLTCNWNGTCSIRDMQDEKSSRIRKPFSRRSVQQMLCGTYSQRLQATII